MPMSKFASKVQLPSPFAIKTKSSEKANPTNVTIHQDSPIGELNTLHDISKDTPFLEAGSHWSLSSASNASSESLLPDQVSVLSFLDCPVDDCLSLANPPSLQNPSESSSAHSRTSSSWSERLSKLSKHSPKSSFSRHSPKPSVTSSSNVAVSSNSFSKPQFRNPRTETITKSKGFRKQLSRAKRLVKGMCESVKHIGSDDDSDYLATVCFDNKEPPKALSTVDHDTNGHTEDSSARNFGPVDINNLDSLVDLAIAFKKEKKIEDAIEIFEFIMPRISASHNFVPYELAESYKIRGSTKDLKSIFRLHVLAASLGHEKSAFFVGDAYFYGTYGAHENTLRALQYYHLATDKNNPDAMLALCKLYLKGLPGHIQANSRRAFEYAHRAAMLGYAPACYVLGKFYETGIGCEKDLAKSEAGFRAGLANLSCITDADALQIAMTLVLLQ
ncbi:SEL1/TPR repeat protein, chitin synthase regulatory factor Cfh4/ predicted COA7-like protein [Schizosaccharomyces osmophilus]|uniref:SEL1/TPR repeat protein, chitin synthase regulatory factor Cfh4/ predicted COA7-like protein n=1 Tax=Schizosaccharomyces osmophilus TaxID=2545709 RepID=A0AAE9W8R6_9SCHI|nr:SEL1/TPR repeat protein, chitin synthase regulatory factor Cfh4/ predicted COA7-like protein [Schizosaccharomyces osmophilus]WBW71857.1 SEL1/TPR repeat protein, chitin synthase regulatory factor Cfh4/ predicted COA7-like protein [Schizosaccharomyces osmophilus]